MLQRLDKAAFMAASVHHTAFSWQSVPSSRCLCGCKGTACMQGDPLQGTPDPPLADGEDLKSEPGARAQSQQAQQRSSRLAAEEPAAAEPSTLRGTSKSGSLQPDSSEPELSAPVPAAPPDGSLPQPLASQSTVSSLSSLLYCRVCIAGFAPDDTGTSTELGIHVCVHVRLTKDR